MDKIYKKIQKSSKEFYNILILRELQRRNFVKRRVFRTQISKEMPQKVKLEESKFL